jgi:hypothetical protein
MFGISFTLDDFKRVLWTAAQAFVAVLALGLTDVLNAFKGSGLEGAKAVGLALIGAAIAAAISAVKNLILADGSALK